MKKNNQNLIYKNCENNFKDKGENNFIVISRICVDVTKRYISQLQQKLRSNNKKTFYYR